MIQKISPNNYSGIIQIPASKSDAQRTILCAGLAFGTSLVENIGTSDDEKAMLSTMRMLGARIQYKENNILEFRGIGSLMFNSTNKINVGESGLGVRLMTAIAATSNQEITINGHGSLLKRDLSFFDRTFPQMGVKLLSNQGKLPISVHGPLLGGNYAVDGSESSQYISGLLMALPFAEEDSLLTVENLASSSYVAMTLKTMKIFGIEIQQSEDVFSIKGNQNYSASEYSVDGDWSSASCWLVASALGKDLSVKGLSMESLQADKQLLDALVGANCVINHSKNGISINGSQRRVLNFDATDCPDLFPALVLFASLTEGKSIIKGVHRLANKESNRGLTLQSEFGKLGITIELNQDEMIVHGKSAIKGGMVSSHGDHRIAMCFGIAGMFAESEIIIDGAETVAKSYPDFWKHLQQLIN